MADKNDAGSPFNFRLSKRAGMLRKLAQDPTATRFPGERHEGFRADVRILRSTKDVSELNYTRTLVVRGFHRPNEAGIQDFARTNFRGRNGFR